MSVVVKIQDPTGTEIGSFDAEDEKNLCEMAAMHGIEILRSCGAWFCWVCMCEILEGGDDAFKKREMKYGLKWPFICSKMQ